MSAQFAEARKTMGAGNFALVSQQRPAKRVLDVLQGAFIAGAAGFLLAGVAFVVVGRRDHGFALVSAAVIFAGLLLLLRLYRGRYRL